MTTRFGYFLLVAVFTPRDSRSQIGCAAVGYAADGQTSGQAGREWQGLITRGTGNCGRHALDFVAAHCDERRRVGIMEVDEGIWIVSFMQYDLGYIDLEQKTLQPLDNSFGMRLSPMS
jgi:hypothetical protein